MQIRSRIASRVRRLLPTTEQQKAELFSLYEYKDDSGHFAYDKYLAAQVEANHRKIDCVWAQEGNIRFLSDYIRTHIGQPKFGLCHGTRRGLEQQWFRQNLGCEVIGTEISDTAKDFPNTIQWDFHEVKHEWIGAADFIYSNSLDHSYDPRRCLAAWTSCLRPNGLLIIEHSSDDVKAKESDPFGASIASLPYLILSWSKGAYAARELINAPQRSRFKERSFDTYFLIVQRNDASGTERPLGGDP